MRNQVVSSLVWLWWVIDLARFEFEFGIVLFCFSFTLVSFEESRLLVSCCAGGRCGVACNNEGCGRSRRPGAEDRGWSHRSGTRWPGGREVGWRRVRSAPGTWRLGVRVKDRRRRPEGGEWEPIKILLENLAYIPKSTRRPSLLTRPRPHSYSTAIGPQNQARNCSRNTEWC
jgi:hypothetical protein